MGIIKQRGMEMTWAQIRPRLAALVRSRSRKMAKENVIISLEEQNSMESSLFKRAAEAVRAEEGKGSRVHIDEVTQRILELAESLVFKLGGEVNEHNLVTLKAKNPELAALLREAMGSSEIEGEINRVLPEFESDTQSQPHVAVSSQLMQNYRLAKPFVPGSRIATAFNQATGLTELFTVDTSGRLLNVYSDHASDTGWSVIDLNFPTSIFDACDQPDGSIVVYALDSTGKIQYNLKIAETWKGWTPVPSPVVPVNQPFTFYSVVDIKAHRTYGNKYYKMAEMTFLSTLCVVINNPTGVPYKTVASVLPDPYQPATLTWNWGEIASSSAEDWCPAFVLSPDWMPFYYGAYTYGNVAVNFGQVLAGTAVQQNKTPAQTDGAYRLYDTNGRYSGLLTSPGWQNALHSGLPSGYRDELFALRTDNASGSETFAYHLPFDYTAKLFSPRKLSDVPVSAIAARTMTPGPNGRIELFAVGADKFLYHIRQFDDNQNCWSPFLQLEQDTQFHQVIAGRDPGLYSEAFAVATDGRLLHLWQADADDEWHFDWVELATTRNLEGMSTYTMQLTVFDASGVPASGTLVRIFSDQPVVLDVNGLTCIVRPNLPWDCVTLAKGTTTIGMRVDTLGMPLLKVWTAFMPANDRIVLDGSAPIRDRLQQIDADKLNAAQVTSDQGQQTPLLNDKARNATNTLVNTLHASMKVAAQLVPTPTLTPNKHRAHFHRLNDHRVTRYISDDKPKAVAAKVAMPAWQLDFTSELPVFTTLNTKQAKQLRVEQATLPHIATAITLPQLAWDWGSVFGAVENGLVDLASVFVDGLTTTLTLIVDGAKYIFSAVIEFIEQVFDVIEEAFRAVGIAFEQLFRWLGYIFAWDDILRSQEAIEHLWDQMQQFLKASIQKIRSVAEPGGLIDGYKSDVKQQFDGFVANILPQNEQFGSLRPDPSTPPTGAELALHQSAGTNVFHDGLMHATAGSITPTAWLELPRTAAVAETVDQLGAALASTSQEFQASNAFSEALKYFEAIPDKPDQFLQLVAAGVVKIVEGITLFALDAAAAVITKLCDAALAVLDEVWALLQEAWDVPLLSEMYAQFTDGKTLTTINLLALLVATPATVLYKLANGKATFPDNDPTAAPFPDSVSLSTFKSTITSQWMIQQAGLNDTASESTPQTLLEENTALIVARKFSASCYAINSLGYVGVDFVVDLLASPNPENYWKGRWKPDPTTASRLALAHTWLDPVFSIPWLMGSEGGFGCDDADEFGNLVWLLQGIGIFLDTVAYWRDGKVTRQAFSGAGVWISSVWGAVNLGLSIAEAVKQAGDDKAASAAGVLSSVPGVFKWMAVYPGRTTPIGAIMVLVLLGLDVVCDGSAAGIAIAEVFASEDDTSASIH